MQAVSTVSSGHTPENLEPSELGTKQYWEDYYQEDLATLQDEDTEDRDIVSLSTWFDDVKAPQKIIEFLINQEFPLAPCHFLSTHANDCPSVLDLGTGNGHTLFQLRLQGKFKGQMVGVDYSKASIQLAQELGNNQDGCQDIKFDVMDIIKDDIRKREWWLDDGFDLVLDKGTFDAISLSDEASAPAGSHPPQPDQALTRAHALYPSRTLSMVKPGGFLLVTSCNWTQEELIYWFTNEKSGSTCGISVWKTIKYPKFEYGGHVGQAVCTVCFRKDLTPASILLALPDPQHHHG